MHMCFSKMHEGFTHAEIIISGAMTTRLFKCRVPFRLSVSERHAGADTVPSTQTLRVHNILSTLLCDILTRLRSVAFLQLNKYVDWLQFYQFFYFFF